MKYFHVKSKIVKTRIVLLFVLCWFSSNAFSQQFLVVKFKDGHEQAIPLADIDKIDFRQSGGNETQPMPTSRLNLSGRWSGTYHNTLGDSGKTMVTLSDDGNKVTVDWDGSIMTNVQRSGQTLRWNFRNSTATYSVELQFIGDGKIRLTYQATSGTKNYSGYVNDYVQY